MSPPPSHRRSARGAAILGLWIGLAGASAAVPAAAADPDAGAVVLVADCEGGSTACSATVAALERLADVPRRHAAVLVDDLDAVEIAGGRVPLAVIEVVSAAGPQGARGNALELARARGHGEAVSPDWLVAAAVRAAEAAGGARDLEPRLPGAEQILARATLPPTPTVADRALASGVAALRFRVRPGDGAPIWIAATVRRIDVLAGPPRADAQYLVASGRVWGRRSLYWLLGALWAALVVVGRPGRWRRSSAEGRRRRGEHYLRGLPFRVLFLATALWAPAPALPLLVPAALVTFVPAGGARRRIARRLAVYGPTAVLLVATALSTVSGAARLRAPGPTALLVVLSLAAWELAETRRHARAPE